MGYAAAADYANSCLLANRPVFILCLTSCQQRHFGNNSHILKQTLFKGSCLSFPSIWTTHWWIPELPTSDVGKLGGCGPNPPQPCLASSLHVALSPTPVNFAGAKARSDSSARNLKCRSNWFSMDREGEISFYGG